jgi:hypothetical protein
MPGFHTRYTGMPGLNSYSMPGSATCDTGHKALCPVSRRVVRRGINFPLQREVQKSSLLRFIAFFWCQFLEVKSSEV